MSTRPLEREFQYFLDHQKELVARYRGKVLVIKDEQVIGTYDTALEAVRETSQEHEPGTFLVQECKPGAAAYTAVFCGLHAAPVN
ncbi:MAG: hypothetical protein KKI08_04285 [Armatimonadetes bacterium]|nr:hypothetical protein [Armatimonadota bacterium]